MVSILSSFISILILTFRIIEGLCVFQPLPAKNSDPKDVLLTMVTKCDCLAQHVDSLLMSDEPVADSGKCLKEQLFKNLSANSGQ